MSAIVDYLEEKDQYFQDQQRTDTGSTFAMDGSDYDPSVPQPDLIEMARYLRSAKRGPQIQVTIIGKLYTGSSKISGVSFTTDIASMRKAGENKHSLEGQVAIFAGLTQIPEKVTGLYVRPLD